MRFRVLLFTLWISLGTFGAHRYLLKKNRTGTILLCLSGMQVLLIFFTFGSPLKLHWILCFWPPISAFQNVKALLEMLLPTYVHQIDPEKAFINPILFFVTLPSILTTAWAIFDGFKIFHGKNNN